MIEWTGTQNKISVEGECSDPVSVILQRVEQLALKARDSERFDGKSGKANRTPFASQMRTVRSDDAVYSTPMPLSPPPPHRTTFTLAVCPPNVYSSLRVLTAHTLTVPSFEEDANRGAEGFLIPVPHKSEPWRTGNRTFRPHVYRFPGQRHDPF